MDLIYDWNTVRRGPSPSRAPQLNDETLRDGLQSPSVRMPDIEQKIALLHLMAGLRMDAADIGLPGAGPAIAADAERLACEIRDAGLAIRPNCAARTVIDDIRPIAEISQRVGLAIECCTFIGSSPIRQEVQGWSLEHLQRLTEDAVTFAVREGLPVTYVTEDTTRAAPDTLRQLYLTAIRAGASRLCVADTTGHATPAGAAAVVHFVAAVAADSGTEAGIDWHGHDDRGLGIINAIAAFEAGASRLHATALGMGERVGNTPMDLLLVNLVLMGYLDRHLGPLGDYCRIASQACGREIPVNYPVFGRDAFRTATGVHAAALLKAVRRGDRSMADTVYSGVPAHLVGREQEIEIGPMSGRSNVVFWLERRSRQASDLAIERVLARAKAAAHVLSDDEISAALRD